MIAPKNMTESRLPTHVGIIMDGNGRWATRRGLPRKAGHKKGANVFEKIVDYANKQGIRFLTVYAFSTENFKRPPDEVDTIMDLMRSYLKDRRSRTNDKIRTLFIGDCGGLAPDIQQSIAEMEEITQNNKEMVLNIAFNYGGQLEILQAAKQIAQEYRNGAISLEDLTEESFAAYLYTKQQPPVDVVIRTSGEQRTSNFLIWQAAYAELIFVDELWPDFTTRHFDQAMEEYNRRERRIGGLAE